MENEDNFFMCKGTMDNTAMVVIKITMAQETAGI
jgi:hypothetical protein